MNQWINMNGWADRALWMTEYTDTPVHTDEQHTNVIDTGMTDEL